jgi:hypothetical protein
MSNTTTKVLAGCGVGCLLIVLALGGVAWMGYRWAKTAAEVIEEAGRAEDQLEAEYGQVQEFTPPLDGRIPVDRIEAFLAVRDSMAPERTALSDSIEALAPAKEGGAVGGLRAARAGIGMAPRLIEFAGARNRALLEIGMGPGEYTWIYWLTYHAWLDHPVGDSLLNDIMEASDESGGSMHMHIEGMDTEHAEQKLRRDLQAMLRNLEREIEADSAGAGLKELVVGELAAIDEDHRRLPWSDGLPEAFVVGLDAYRDRFEASYSRATNPFELLELNPGPHGVIIE